MNKAEGDNAVSKHNRERRRAGVEKRRARDDEFLWAAIRGDAEALAFLDRERAEQQAVAVDRVKAARYPVAPTYTTHVGTHTGPKTAKGLLPIRHDGIRKGPNRHGWQLIRAGKRAPFEMALLQTA